MIKRINWMFAIGCLLVSPVRAADNAAPDAKTIINGQEVKLAHYAKAFLAAGNIRIEVAPYKAADGSGSEGALLFFHGIESDWDGKVINHFTEPGAYEGFTYVTDDTKRWHTLVMQKQNDKAKYWLYIPGGDSDIELIPSDGAAQLTTPQAIYEEYQSEQKASKP